MTLTGELGRADSRVRKAIAASTPTVALAGTRGAPGREASEALGFDRLLASEVVVPIPAEVTLRNAHASTVGAAVDYRVRMALPGFDLERSVAMRTAQVLERRAAEAEWYAHPAMILRSAVDRVADWLEGPKTDLDRAAVVLAWADAIGRAGPKVLVKGSLSDRVFAAADGAAFAEAVPQVVVDDVAALVAASASEIEQWRADIEQGARYDPAPELSAAQGVGGADPDLLVDQTLIELKCVETLSVPRLRKFLMQLLGYVLLDEDDDLRVRRVGLLLPRQGRFVTWDLEQLLGPDVEDRLFAGRLAMVDALPYPMW